MSKYRTGRVNTSISISFPTYCLLSQRLMDAYYPPHVPTDPLRVELLRRNIMSLSPVSRNRVSLLKFIYRQNNNNDKNRKKYANTVRHTVALLQQSSKSLDPNAILTVPSLLAIYIIHSPRNVFENAYRQECGRNYIAQLPLLALTPQFS